MTLWSESGVGSVSAASEAPHTLAPRCRYVIVLSGVRATILATPAPPAIALLTSESQQTAGAGARREGLLDLKEWLRCRGCGRKGRAGVSVEWRARGRSLRWGSPPPARVSSSDRISADEAAPGGGITSTPLPLG